jgi:exodeoxyribonuclease V gamma subunit
VGTDGVARLRPVERPEALLAQLLETFRQGLCRPLPFFPDAAMDFLNLTHAAGKPVKSALETIRTKWTGSDFRRGAAVDPYHRLCFGNADPFGETFIGLAEAVGAPLRRHLEEAP